MTLASLLRGARTRMRLSLREVERRTGISNGYLSLLENGSAKRPSPEFLAKLSTLYGASYELLMELAGYQAPQPLPPLRAIPGLEDVDDLSLAEMDQLRAFVGYLRSSRPPSPDSPSEQQAIGSRKRRH